MLSTKYRFLLISVNAKLDNLLSKLNKVNDTSMEDEEEEAMETMTDVVQFNNLDQTIARKNDRRKLVSFFFVHKWLKSTNLFDWNMQLLRAKYFSSSR